MHAFRTAWLFLVAVLTGMGIALAILSTSAFAMKDCNELKLGTSNADLEKRLQCLQANNVELEELIRTSAAKIEQKVKAADYVSFSKTLAVKTGTSACLTEGYAGAFGECGSPIRPNQRFVLEPAP